MGVIIIIIIIWLIWNSEIGKFLIGNLFKIIYSSIAIAICMAIPIPIINILIAICVVGAIWSSPIG